MLNLVIVNVGNSSRTEISIVVLTHIAWVTIVTSVQKVSYDLQSRRGQRIFPVGGRGCRSIVLSLQNETRPTTQIHPPRSPDRQLRH